MKYLSKNVKVKRFGGLLHKYATLPKASFPVYETQLMLANSVWFSFHDVYMDTPRYDLKEKDFTVIQYGWKLEMFGTFYRTSKIGLSAN